MYFLNKRKWRNELYIQQYKKSNNFLAKLQKFRNVINAGVKEQLEVK